MTRFRLILSIFGLIGLIAAIAIPNYMKSRQASRTSACISNLIQLDGAKQCAAMEFNLAEGSIVSASNVDSCIKGGTQCLKCPDDPKHSFNTSYSLGVIGSKPVCLINPGSHRL